MRYFISTILSFVVFFGARAQEDLNFRQHLSGSQIVPNAVFQVEDEHFFDLNKRAKMEDPFSTRWLNTIVFTWNEEARDKIPADVKVTIHVAIQYTISGRNGETIDSLADHVLEIEYKDSAAMAFKAKDIFSFEGASRVSIRLKSIQTTPSVSWNVEPYLSIYSDITPYRDYIFDCAVTITQLSLTNPYQSSTNPDELLVSWQATQNGQTEYDVEWAWIDENLYNEYHNGTRWLADKCFHNNSSRITISANSSQVKIPVMYDQKGYVLVRVRHAQIKQDGTRIEGAWSYADLPPLDANGNPVGSAPGLIAQYLFNGHDVDQTIDKKTESNWQATTTFAEEGKRKTVIQYFDGTLRSRQTVTKNNTDGTIVVAESFYDFQGRPIIQVLPAPTLDNVIQFTRDFNQWVQPSTDPKDIYDRINNGQILCTAGTDGLSTVSGASKYYSPQNPDGNNGDHNAFIPDAEKYPYSETRYSNDGTGRIAAQGGVGKDYQVNSDRATKYYYSVPSKQELDALFGTEAGDASHYAKNTVRDANGQYSVSILDMKGRTVATALIGANPGSLDTLPGYTANQKTLTVSLLNPHTNVIKGRNIESSSSLVVPEEGVYDFEYRLGPQELVLAECLGACYNCYYRLTIRITDDCKLPTEPGHEIALYQTQNFTLGQLDQLCNGTNPLPGFSWDYAQLLNKGSYTITKILSVAEDAQEEYRTTLFKEKNVCITLQQFIDNELTWMQNGISCNMTCAECETAVGTYSQFRTRLISQTGLSSQDAAAMEGDIIKFWEAAVADCKRICGPVKPNMLEKIKLQMLQDLRPMNSDDAANNSGLANDPSYANAGGQYANPARANSPYNIFNPNFGANQGNAYYVFSSPVPGPLFKKTFEFTLGNQTISTFYKNTDGTLSSINNQLAGITKEQFIFNFEPQWAESLLPFHPEYKRYKVAESIKSSYEFDEMLNSITTYSAAYYATTLGGYLNASKILDADPFFVNNSTLKGQMAFEMNNYAIGTLTLNMYRVAWGMINCRSESLPCAGVNTPSIPIAPPSICPADWNKVWELFRLMYISKKAKFVNEYIYALSGTGQLNSALENEQYAVRFLNIGATINLANITNTQPPAFDTDPDDPPHNNSQEQAFYTSQGTQYCESYINGWIEKLKACDQIADALAIDPGYLEVLLSKLKTICIGGSNKQHPFGAGSMPSPPPGQPANFEAAIMEFLTANSIDLSSICHPFLIDFPKPQNSGQAIFNQQLVMTDQPEKQCACDKLTSIKSAFSSQGGQGTLVAFIQNKYGTTITQAQLQQLETICSSQTCVIVEPALQLPAIFQCNTTLETCIDCDQLNGYKDDFLTLMNNAELTGFPFVGDEIEEYQVAWNQAFSAFINYKTGFSFPAHTYLEFFVACQATTQFTCPSLNQTVNEFLALYGNQLSGPGCEALFASFFNNKYQTIYNWDQIMTIFQQTGCSLPDICAPKLNCTQLMNVLRDFYDTYRLQINSGSFNCQVAFTNFFNTWMGEGYHFTWEQIMEFYRVACGYVPDLCQPLNCTRINMAFDHFMANEGQDLESSLNCQGDVLTWFNNYFGTNFNWEAFYEYAKECGLPEEICVQGYSCSRLEEQKNLFFETMGMGIEDMGGTEHCEEYFTTYFNEKNNTDLTFLEIKQIYQSVCNVDLNICVIKPHCNSIQDFYSNYSGSLQSEYCTVEFTDQFNAYFNTSYTYLQIKDLILQECGINATLCDAPVAVLTCQQIESVVLAFIDKNIDPVITFGSNCEDEFASYFNLAYQSSLDFGQISNIYFQQCGKVLDVCTAAQDPALSCERIRSYLQYYESNFGTMQLPRLAAQKLVTTTWKSFFKLKVNVFYNLVEDQMIPCATTAYPLPDITGTIPTVLDANSLSSMLRLYYVIKPNLVPGNVQEDFRAFFNSYLQQNLSYYAIETEYYQTAGITLTFSDGTVNNTVTLYTYTPQTVSTELKLCGLQNSLFSDVTLLPDDPCKDINQMAYNSAVDKYNLYLEQANAEFNRKYLEKCLEAKNLETFTVTFSQRQHHYTLYYYDNADNLVKTVPPQGIDIRNMGANSWSDDVDQAKQNGVLKVPNHQMVTTYRYNTLNQVISQQTPDGGLSKFYYDILGRLVVSQNAKQQTLNEYSYTLYDYLGRITEVGQLTSTDPMTSTISKTPSQLSTWITAAANTRVDVTRTVYDQENTEINTPGQNTPAVLVQQNLRNRVSYSEIYPVISSSQSLPSSATYYTYDIHGNVNELVQDYGQGSSMALALNRFKRIQYKYDLISGKVNEVSYQPDRPDAFYHKYYYDAENRITSVKVSRDRIIWDEDARYTYYRHGPLARDVIGHLQVQGLDYAYTLQGWLKGVNSTSLNPLHDIGRDGTSFAAAATDVFGFALHYNNDDYKQVYINPSQTVPAFAAAPSVLKNLFNGNIGGMSVNIGKLNQPLYYNYNYDQLNRLVAMDAYSGLQTNNTWSIGSPMDAYKERINYDANGNIYGYLRNGAPGNVDMDSMRYWYYYKSTAIGPDGKPLYKKFRSQLNRLPQLGDSDFPTDLNEFTNRLSHVGDIVADGAYPNTSHTTEDVNNQDEENYRYDEIGNLIKDVKEGITNIQWNVYGKIKQINKSNGTIIKYTYDVSGNRISKDVNGKQTWYVRDASGNVMSVYELDVIIDEPLVQTELHIYGSSRIGILLTQLQVENIPDLSIYLPYLPVRGIKNNFGRGNKRFELTNHLGNVLTTISDKRIPITIGGLSLIDHYNPDVISANDYYPFGMTMPGRSYSASSSYRYGFNGKENDNEVKGEGNQQDYGMRIYDPRIGRFLSLDPLTDSYPWNSPYSYAEGDPINYIDLDGAETNTTTAAATVKPTTPALSPRLSVNPNGRMVNNTQLFTSGEVHSGMYAPQTRYVTQAELNSLIPPGSGAYINQDGESMTVYNSNGSWQVSLIKRVHKAKSICQMNWLERALMRIQLEQIKLHNTFTQWNSKIQAFEIITTDPSQLTNEYLNDVNKRLLIGSGTEQDNQYAAEIAKRKVAGAIIDPAYVNFIRGKGEKAKKITAIIPEGYKKTKLVSHGQAVYTNGKYWITPDTDGHNPDGIWKKFDKEKNVGSTDKNKRVGTFGRDINHRVGD